MNKEKVTIEVPDPVPPTIVLRLTVAEARAIQWLAGNARAGGPLSDLWEELKSNRVVGRWDSYQTLPLSDRVPDLALLDFSDRK